MESSFDKSGQRLPSRCLTPMTSNYRPTWDQCQRWT
jgi:hypothetical protein